MNKKVKIITLGCRANQYESNAIAEQLIKKGYEISDNINDCGKVIVNTCAVTAESERKSRQTVRKAAKNAEVYVIGCASQLGGFDNIENVRYIGGCKDKLKVIDAIIEDADGMTDGRTSMEGAKYENMRIDGTSNLFSDCRAFLKIQDGCSGKCSYCIIPKCRGKSRSRSFDDIISEADRLALNGYKEIILTGIETASYNKAPLYEIIDALSDIKEIKRVRLGSLTPNIIGKRFLKSARASSNFMPHFHLSLQSCSDNVLKNMRRPYRKKDIFECVSLIREYLPNAQLSADIIVGFPGETESEFIETVEAVKELGLFHVHSFPYSEREGTEAALMKNKVPKNIRHERNRILINESDKIKKEILDTFKGKKASVLIEKIKNGYAYGHTEEFLEARFKNNGNGTGDIVEVDIISNDGNILETEKTSGGLK